MIALLVGCLTLSCAHSKPQTRDARCLAVRGCPAANALPACAAASAPPGGDVVEGRLTVGEVRCTEVLCPGRCCNDCTGQLALFDGHRNVVLVGAGLEVRGDDSTVCFATGRRDQAVVARGTLQPRPAGGTQLVVTAICAR